jgi:hypothetical protein
MVEPAGNATGVEVPAAAVNALGSGVSVNSRMLARCLSSSSIARVNTFFRLPFSWTRYRDCPGRRLRMSRSYRGDGRAARSATTMRPRQ